MDSLYILPFTHCNKESLPRVGGKCASLGTMIQAGAPVPPGFAVTTDAYLKMLGNNGLNKEIASLLATVDPAHVSTGEQASHQIRQLLESVAIPDQVAEAVRDAYHTLSQQCGLDAVSVAVRSSATAEDLPNASFAGQQDTFLWVTGAESVLTHIRKCWSSLFTARAISYRTENGFPHDKLQMSVGVQKMVNAKAAGVAFTLNPINGDRSKIAIDSSWGLGEGVVSGEVTPDNFLLDKVIFEVVSRTISPKHIEFVADTHQGGTIKRPVSPERIHQSSLTQEELIAVAQLAKRAEKHYRHPQDVEWAIDADLPAPNNVVLLQSRPETVWSRKDRQSVSAGMPSGLEGLVHTLNKGVKTR